MKLDLSQNILLDIVETKDCIEYKHDNGINTITKLVLKKDNISLPKGLSNTIEHFHGATRYYKDYTIKCTLQEWVNIIVKYNTKIL